MKKSIIASFLLLLGLSARGQAENPKTLSSAGSLPLPAEIQKGTHAIWSGGALVFMQDAFSASPTIQVLDRDGRELSRFSFAIPGMGRINVYDNSIAQGEDGSIALAGSAYGDEAVLFVAWISPDRQKQTIIRTNPFFPVAVAIASDGTIWVAGDSREPKPAQPDLSQNLIRHCDNAGKLLGSFVSWSSLQWPTSFLAPSPVTFSALLALKDGVGWYSPASGAYIEFALDGTITRRFSTAPHNKYDMISVVACKNGELFASTSTLGEHRSWGAFALDRERNEWTLGPRDKESLLVGCDGQRLLSMSDSHQLTWLQASSSK
jgi:hypothetical protein